jgi:hypothetical protein
MTPRKDKIPVEMDNRKVDVPEGRYIGRTMDKQKVDVPEGRNNLHNNLFDIENISSRLG